MIYGIEVQYTLVKCISNGAARAATALRCFAPLNSLQNGPWFILSMLQIQKLYSQFLQFKKIVSMHTFDKKGKNTLQKSTCSCTLIKYTGHAPEYWRNILKYLNYNY